MRVARRRRHSTAPIAIRLLLGRRVLRLAPKKRIGWWLLQQLAAFARDPQHAFSLLVLGRQRPTDAHLGAPFALQAGARSVSHHRRPRRKSLGRRSEVDFRRSLWFKNEPGITSRVK